ncbi:MAG: alpha-L-rhamnosidase C-terminal domain-containing protein, partial [Chitinophagaceae bacterium]
MESAPLHNIQSAAPPTILFLGTEDKLVSVETAKNFQNAMRNVKARCELFLYKGQDHGFFNFRNIELYKQTIKELDTFLTSLQYLQASPASVMSYHYNDTSYIKKKVETQPKITPLISGVRLYDFEKAYFGRLRIDVSNLKAGDTFLVHIGEKLDGSGKIDRAPGGTIRYYTYKISKEEGDNLVFVPNLPEKRNTTGKAIRLPEQMGVLAPFRFAEIESVVDTKMINVSREVFHYRFNDNASSFISSDSVLNAIWDLCKHSIKATSFMGLYIDGDRERIPYEADALINQLSHYALDADFDIARNTFEYLMLHPTWPTEWQLQMHQIAWNDYLYSGNTHLISSYYDLLKSKTLEAFLQPNGLISSTAAPQRLSFLDSIYYKTFDAKQGLRDITDWPQRGNKIAGPEYIGESDGFVFCPYNSVVNAFYYQSLRLMKEFAILLGKQEDVKFYNRRIQEVYNQFNEVFVDKLTGLVRDGDTTQHSSFHANFFALCFGLIKEQNKTQVLSFIQSKDMACSVYGSQFLLDALYKEGLGDYGLTMLTKRDERSWYHMLELGAGMTMEAWDLKFKPNLDWNHAWGAAPSNIIAFRLMGIQPEAPGFSRALIRPEISRLTSAAIRLPTVKGEIVEKIEQTDESYTIEIQLPPQMIGRLELPMFNPNAKSIRINGKETVVKNNGKKYLLGNIQGTHHI